jgi:hypothetical protein
VHVTLEAHIHNQIAEDIDRVITSIGLYMCHVTVTIEIDTSLRFADFQPSSYYAKLDKLKWLVHSCRRDHTQYKLTCIGSTSRKRRTRRNSQT